MNTDTMISEDNMCQWSDNAVIQQYTKTTEFHGFVKYRQYNKQSKHLLLSMTPMSNCSHQCSLMISLQQS